MKINHIKISILFFGMIAIFASCDKIPENEYLIEQGEVEWKGRYVVLEDYTGHYCVNCPYAATKAEELKELYKEHLIIMAVHAPDGVFTKPSSSYPQDFRTEEGNIWANTFKVSGLPQGMVNRKYFDKKNVLNPDSWAAAVTREITSTPSMNIELDVTYNPTSKQVSLKADVAFLTDVTTDLRIGTFLLQDSIIGAQLKPNTGKDTNYIFNHVLRKTLEGTWGKVFVTAADGIKANNTKEYTLTFTLEDSYTGIAVKPEHCHVIVYVATDEPSKTGDSYQIMQAIEKSIVEQKKK